MHNYGIPSNLVRSLIIVDGPFSEYLFFLIISTGTVLGIFLSSSNLVRLGSNFPLIIVRIIYFQLLKNKQNIFEAFVFLSFFKLPKDIVL